MHFFLLLAEAFPLDPSVDSAQDGRFLSQFFYMLLMLSILVGMLLFITYFLKRITLTRLDQLNTTSTIKIVERRALSNKTTVCILDIEGEKLVVAETPTGLVPLYPKKNQEL